MYIHIRHNYWLYEERTIDYAMFVNNYDGLTVFQAKNYDMKMTSKYCLNNEEMAIKFNFQ